MIGFVFLVLTKITAEQMIKHEKDAINFSISESVNNDETKNPANVKIIGNMRHRK